MIHGSSGTEVAMSEMTHEKPIVPRLDERAQKYNVKVGLHNHWLGDSWFKGDRALNFDAQAGLFAHAQRRITLKRERRSP